MKKKILVEGMSCAHCVKHVKEALIEINGVTKVDVDLPSKIAIVEASQEIKDQDIDLAIDDAGYEVIQIESI